MKRITFLLISVCFIFSLCSCTKEPTKSQLFAMDTLMSFTVYGDNAEKALSEAEKEIKQLEKLFSVTDENSTVSKINASNGKEITVTDDILIPLSVAKEINSASGGALNITTLPLTKAWGFLSKEYRIPDNSELELLLQKVNMQNVITDEKTVTCKDGTMIDLGSVAKGYASQKITEILSSYGITSAIISLGGNVQTLGTKPDGSLWNIVIADPQNSDTETVGSLHIGQSAVVTSGAYQRFFEKDGKKYHHILNPETGYPSDSDVLSVTVICSDGTYADGLSTALFVMGSEKAIDLYTSQKITFDAVIITKDNEVIVTDGIKDNFTLNENGIYHYEKDDK